MKTSCGPHDSWTMNKEAERSPATIPMTHQYWPEKLVFAERRFCFSPRGNLFEPCYDSLTMCYVAEGPVLGGSVVPLQGDRVRLESRELDTKRAMDELISQLTEKGY